MKKSKILAGGILMLSIGLHAETLPYQDPNLSPEERAADLVARMTLQQKIDQIGHNTSAIPMLNLKGYNYWNEAIHGVARSGLATSFPVSKALSATWDLPLIFDVATAISDECRIYNNNSGKGLIYWCPTINMSRDPRWGRDEENYGEDPWLTGRIAVEFIKGMQGNDDKYYKTIATAKHFAANNYERGRHSTSSDMDDRNLREYYLPAFEMAVKEANVRSVMSAYNAVNGVPCGANHELLIDILRGEWGFDGFVTSDCGAVEDVYNKHHYVKTGAEATALSIVNGEDLNCGDTFQEYCKEAIEKGLMTEADLNRALTRVLAARFSVGEFDPASSVCWAGISNDLLNCEDHQRLALKAAREAIVLLKNDNNFLPLSKDKSVAIIGPQGNTVILGGYSGSPTALTTVLEGVAAKMDYVYDDGTVQFEDCTEQSVASGNKRLTHEANGSSGNLGYIFNNDWVAFENVHFGSGRTHLDVYHAAKNNNATTVKFYLDDMAGDPIATVACPVTGNWSKYVVSSVEVDPAVCKGTHKVYTKFEGGINGDKYCANMDWFRFYDPTISNPLEVEGPVYFFKGCDITGTASTDIERAKEIAAKADVVIFCGGTDLSVSDESHDRTSLDLPGEQQKLLEAIYTVNPNIVLLLQTCSSMTVNWAQRHLPAIVEAWYDGQAQGEAIADVLYGDFNPSGHLTSTWYNSLSDIPTDMLNYDIRDAGYTYMYHRRTPLYPFGHGLSYTDFKYTDMTISSDHLNKDEEVTISANIQNIGNRAGADVVQLYAHCHSELDRPLLQLVGFTRVELEPGESTTITIPLKHEQLAYFNVDAQTFDVEEGTVDLMLAESASDVRLRSSLTTQGATVKVTYKSDPASIQGILNEPKGGTQKGYFDLTGRYLGNSPEHLAPGYYVTGGKVILKK